MRDYGGWGAMAGPISLLFTVALFWALWKLVGLVPVTGWLARLLP
jgi:hypothetical protein